jgi:hypothetical protein
VIVLIVTALTGTVFYSLYNKNTPHPFAASALNLSYNVVLHILFIAGFKLLMTPWWCNPATQNLFPFEDYGQKYAIHIPANIKDCLLVVSQSDQLDCWINIRGYSRDVGVWC